MTLPDWLSDRVGVPTRGRGCIPTQCIVCHQDVLAGFDNDTCAQAVIADLTPLSPLGEALALVNQRRTYELSRHGSGVALYHRDHWQISGRIAGYSEGTLVIVLTDHKCGTPPLPGITIQPTPLTTPKNSLIYDNEPPF